MEEYMKRLYIADQRARGVYKPEPEPEPAEEIAEIKKMMKQKKIMKNIDDYDDTDDIINDIIKEKPNPRRVQKMIKRYLIIKNEDED